MNSNNACDNSCYRVCKLWVFWAVCCAELLTCSAELPPQSSHSDRYSGSLVLSPRAKLGVFGKQLNSTNCRTIPFVQFCLWQQCLTLIRKKWGKTLIFSYFDLVRCVLGWCCQKILVVYSGTIRALVAVLQASLHPPSLKLLRTSMKLRVEIQAEYNFK